MDVARALDGVRRLSDGELLAGLSGALGANRRLVALVLAHLAEVDERRLHLLAGDASLFVYCTGRLGMSEDEAYRRIRVARLARRFPVVLEQLAGGVVSLSVAALVEPHITEGNHVALLAAVSRKTVQEAREVLAAWFPKPDVLPFIRKLPERSGAAVVPSGGAQVALEHMTAAGEHAPASPSGERVVPVAQALQGGSRHQSPPASGAFGIVELGAAGAGNRAARTASELAGGRPLSSVEALSPGRYRVQLTVDAELKRKIDLARDLLRHALPQGDLATIVGRAVDLLIEETLRRRFGGRSKKGSRTPREGIDSAGARDSVVGDRGSNDGARAAAMSANAPSPGTSERPAAATERGASQPSARRSEPDADAGSSVQAPGASASRRLSNLVRRTVLERDGLRCTWQAPDGTRCGSQAWLEHDHVTPHGQGGSNDAANCRILCRAHNRLAAERAYGRQTITRVIARRRTARSAAAGSSGGQT